MEDVVSIHKHFDSPQLRDEVRSAIQHRLDKRGLTNGQWFESETEENILIGWKS